MNNDDYDFQDWTDEQNQSATLGLHDAAEAMSEAGLDNDRIKATLLVYRVQRGLLDYDRWQNRLANGTERAINAHKKGKK